MSVLYVVHLFGYYIRIRIECLLNFLELWPKYSDISGFNGYNDIFENRITASARRYKGTYVVHAQR